MEEWKTCGFAGIRTLIHKSQERDDTIHLKLEALLASDGDATVSCHKSCYSKYTSVSRNVTASKKRKSGGLEHGDECHKRISRSQVPDFVFKRDCLFCGERCDPKDPKNPQKWVPVNQCV